MDTILKAQKAQKEKSLKAQKVDKADKILFSKGKKEKVLKDMKKDKKFKGDKFDKKSKFDKGFKGDKHDKAYKGDKLFKGDKVINDSKDKMEKQMVEAKDEKMAKKKGKKVRDHAKTRAARAGLVFPVARLHNKLKSMVPSNARVGGTAAVFMAAVIEYLVAELCELAGNKAKAGQVRKGNEKDDKKRARINPRFIQYAINEDHEFAELLSRVTLAGGGVIPLTDKKLKEQTTAKSGKKNKNILDMPEMQDDMDSDMDM